MSIKKNALELDIDLAKFAPGVNNPPRKYGLPAKVAFCANCWVSNQRPNSAVEFQQTENSRKETIHLDDDEVCDACRTADCKDAEID